MFVEKGDKRRGEIDLMYLRSIRPIFFISSLVDSVAFHVSALSAGGRNEFHTFIVALNDVHNVNPLPIPTWSVGICHRLSRNNILNCLLRFLFKDTLCAMEEKSGGKGEAVQENDHILLPFSPPPPPNPVASLPIAWRFRVSAGTGWSGVSIL